MPPYSSSRKQPRPASFYSLLLVQSRPSTPKSSRSRSRTRCLGVQPPALVVFVGNLQAETDIVQQCRVALFFRAYWLLPTLPDPYAASFDTMQIVRSQEGANTSEILFVQIQWNGAPTQPVIQLALAISSQANNGLGFLGNVDTVRGAGGLRTARSLQPRRPLRREDWSGPRSSGQSSSAKRTSQRPQSSDLPVSHSPSTRDCLPPSRFPRPRGSRCSQRRRRMVVIAAGINAADGGPLVLHSAISNNSFPWRPFRCSPLRSTTSPPECLSTQLSAFLSDSSPALSRPINSSKLSTA